MLGNYEQSILRKEQDLLSPHHPGHDPSGISSIVMDPQSPRDPCPCLFHPLKDSCTLLGIAPSASQAFPAPQGSLIPSGTPRHALLSAQ